MSTAAGQDTALITTLAGGLILVFMRVLVFRWVCQSRGGHFKALSSLRGMLQVIGSFCVPGLGQASQGRFEIASLHLISTGALWLSAGWFALPLHFVSALEAVRR